MASEDNKTQVQPGSQYQGLELLREETSRIVDLQFLKSVTEKRDAGMTEREIADELGTTISQLRVAIAMIKDKLYSKAEEKST